MEPAFHPGISNLEKWKFSVINILCDNHFAHHQARHFMKIDTNGKVFYQEKHVGDVTNVDMITKEEDRKMYIVFDWLPVKERIEHCIE